MSHNTIDQLVGQLKNGQISRRGFVRRATALGISASAAGMLARGAVAQEASPSATTFEPFKSPTLAEYNAAIQEEYQFGEPENTGGEVIIVEITDIQTVNTTLVDDVYSNWIAGLMFESLATLSVVDSTDAPALAEWERAEDGVTHTFHISPTAMWHDGTPVTAADVEFTYNSVLSEESLSPRSGTLRGALKELVVVDDKTVQLIGNSPSAWFVQDAAAQFGILPKHIWENVPIGEFGADGGATGQDPSRVIGSGPFKFVEWVPNDHVTLVKNPDYWDTDNVPYIDNFIFRVVADGNTAIQSVVTGESDIAEVPFAQVEPLRQSSPDLAINNYDTTAFNFYHVNQDPEKQPFFVDIPVRQALHYALDRQLVVDTAYAGFAEVANGTQPVLSFAYAPDRVNTIYNFDPDQARALLEQAGWVDSDGDGVREKDGVKFSFECVYTEGVPTYAQQIPYMQQAWKEVGIEMIPTAVPFPTLSDLVESGGYAMCVQGFSWDFNGDQYAMFGCDQTPPGFNRMRYCNPRFDELREQARVELDDAARLELLIEASNIVNDEMAAGVLFFRQDIYASAPRLHNYVPNGYGEVWSMTKVWVDPS